MNGPTDVLSELMAVIEDRKANPPPRSYTSSLFAAGVEKIGAKIREEADEVLEAAGRAEKGASRDHLIHELADLIYHVFVMMGYCDVRLEDVSAELGRRFGMSGLDEKEARRQTTDTSD